MPLKGLEAGHDDRVSCWFGAVTSFVAAFFLAISTTCSVAQGVALPGKFDVDATGAATYSVAVAVPPGTAGMAPTLSFDYKSQGSDGILGLGWSLSGLSSIGRCARTIAQDGISGGINYDANDRFCMDGQRLVAISGTYGADGTEYRTEIDRFAKIVGRGTAGTGPAWFEVRTKAGRVLQLGNTTDSRLLAAGKATVHAWAVNRIADSAGNYVAVSYTNDASNTQLYPLRIDYTGNIAAGLSPYNSVRFVYSTRPDIVPLYQTGSLIKTTQRLKNVQTYAGTILVTDYRLAYAQGTSTGRSQLTSLTHCDGSNNCLPATTFTWQQGATNQTVVSNVGGRNGTLSGSRPYLGDFNGDGLPDIMWDSQNSTPASSTGTRVLWTNAGGGNFTITSNFAGQDGRLAGHAPLIGDFNRDGRSDIWWSQVGSSGGATKLLAERWISQVAGGLQVNATPTIEKPPFYIGNELLVPPGVANLDGDSRSDVRVLFFRSYAAPVGAIMVPTFVASVWTWKTNNNGEPGAAAAPAAGGVGAAVAGDPSLARTYTVDINGDGKDDLFAVLYGTTTVGSGSYPCGTSGPHQAQIVSMNDGSGGFPTWSIAGCNTGYNAYDPIFADFNGDGKADILWNQVLNASEYKVILPQGPGPSLGMRILWLSKGDGTFEIISNPGGTNGTISGYMPFAGDFNGDGKADVLWVQADTNFVSTGNRVLWLGKGDGTFTAVNNVGGQDGTLIGYAPVLADFNGDGKTDVLWDSRTGTDTRSTGTRVLWLSDTSAPDLMIGVTSGLGATVAVSYKPLMDSSVYTKDNNATDPMIDLQGPMQVVSRIDVSNGIGSTVSSTYTYAGAKANLDGRGFLGFRRKVETDLQSGIVQTTTYRQDYPYQAQVASEARVLGGVTLSSVVNTYGASNLGGTRYDVYLQQKVESGADLDGTALPTLTTTYQYDAYGNATQIAASTSDGFGKTTTHSYVNDTTNWRLGRLTTVSVASTNAQGTATRTSGFSYSPSTGLLTQEVIEPSQSAYRLQTDYTLDAFGSRTGVAVSGVDITTRNATAVYDARGQFKTSAANALNQSEGYQYDVRSGQLTSQTDPNGLTTTWNYDGFGRKTLEVRADGTRTTWSYQYCSGVAGGSASCPANGAYLVQATPQAADGVTQIGAITASYYDQLGRVIANDNQGFDGSLIRSAVQYDTRGRVAQKSRPYFVSGGAARWHVYAYDALNRPLSETAPDTSVTQRAYQGLVMTETNALTQTKVTVKNSQGQTVSITDGLSQTTAYIYDAFSNLTQVTDAAGNVSTFAYDIRGRKAGSNTPDMGVWSYGYNVLGEVTSQTDAKGQATSQVYDLLGRLTQRVEVGLTSTWIYDTALHGIGKLTSASTNGGYQRTHVYDAFGRPTRLQVTADAATYTITTDYDSAGRIGMVTYPSGFAVTSVYNAYGYQTQLKESATNQSLWTANARDAEQHLTQRTGGNGIVTSQSFDTNTGRLSSIVAGVAGAVQSASYTYDTLGNMLNRSDTNTGLSESFGYDALNRLTSATVGVSFAKTFSYSATGNLLSKSDVGAYSYPAPGQPRPHGVVGISGGTLTASFIYDPNGNQTSGAGLTIGYTSFNQPATIARGAASLSFDYDPEHQRFRQLSASGTTLYLNENFASGVKSERFAGSGGTVRWTNYLYAGGELIGMRSEFSDETFATRYFHNDHLGSVAVITDESGAVVERLSYDAWGKRRFPNGTDDPAGSIISQAVRGYTGHETLSDAALINMNARVYDPLLARFASADSIVPNAANGQSWNRYAYVTNNPLKYTDPTGHNEGLPTINVSGTFDGFGYGGWGSAPGFGYNVGLSFGFSGLGFGYVPPLTMGMYSQQARTTAYSMPRYDLFRLPGVSGGDVWSSAEYDPAKDALSGGAGYAVRSSSYSYVGNILHGALTAASFWPAAIGSLAAAAEASLYFAEGDLKSAGILTAAAILGIASDAGLVRMGMVGAKAGAEAITAAKGVAADAKFAQKNYGAMFSAEGKFASRSVDDVADALRSGAMKPGDVPVNYIVRDGQTIMLNTRSAQALEAAGIPRSQWNGVNQTGNQFFENLLNGQLGRNRGGPFDTVRRVGTP
jgi:RHS repeat-associated protein